MWFESRHHFDLRYPGRQSLAQPVKFLYNSGEKDQRQIALFKFKISSTFARNLGAFSKYF